MAASMSYAATVVALFAFRYKNHPKLVEVCYGVQSELSTSRGFYSGDIDFLHCHHRVKSTFGFIAPCRQTVRQPPRSYLPRHSPLVFAPPARAFLSAILNDGIPIAVRLFLIVRRNLERDRLALLEGGATIQADTRNTADSELYRQHLPCLAVRKIRGCTKNGAHLAVGKSSRIKLRRSLGILFVPKANRILGLHAHAPHYSRGDNEGSM